MIPFYKRGKLRLNAIEYLEPRMSPELTLPSSMFFRKRGLRDGDEAFKKVAFELGLQGK